MFLILTLSSAARAADFFSLFGVICIALFWQQFGSKMIVLTSVEKYAVGTAMAAILFFMPVYVEMHKQLGPSLEVDAYKAPAEWLSEHSNPGDIVAHLSFADFPGLFLWNKKNTYLNHADPIFQYKYDPILYGNMICEMGALNGAYDSNQGIRRFCADEKYRSASLVSIFKEGIGARYVFLRSNENPAIIRYFKDDWKLPVVYEDENTTIVEM